MIAHPSTSQLVISVALVLIAAWLWGTGLMVRDRRRTRAATAEWDAAFTGVPSEPAFGGHWAYDDLETLQPASAATAPQPVLYEAPVVPVPSSTLSGPLPVMDSPMTDVELPLIDGDDFMERLRAENRAFLASLG